MISPPPAGQTSPSRAGESTELNELSEFYDERSAAIRAKIKLLQDVNKRISSASEERELAKNTKHLKIKVIKEIRDKKKKKKVREADIERQVLRMRLGQLNPRVAILCDDGCEISQLMFGAGEYFTLSSPKELKKKVFDVVVFDTRSSHFYLSLIKTAKEVSPKSHYLAVVDGSAEFASAVAQAGCSLIIRPPLNKHSLVNLIHRLVTQSPRRGLLSPAPPLVSPSEITGEGRSKPVSPNPTPRGNVTQVAEAEKQRHSSPNTPRSLQHPVVVYLQNLDTHRENEVSILKDELAMLHVEIEKSDDLMHELALQLAKRRGS